MKYVISAVIGFIAACFLYLFNHGGRVFDNGGRADGIRDGIDASANRAKTIASGLTSVASSVERASRGVNKALDIISTIRKRGKSAPTNPNDKPSVD